MNDRRENRRNISEFQSQLQRFGRWLIQSTDASMLRTGIGIKVLLKAGLLTAITYLLANFWFTTAIDRAWENARFDSLTAEASTDQRASELLEVVGADKKLLGQDFVRSPLTSEDVYSKTIILNTIVALHPSFDAEKDPQKARDLVKLLDRTMTGNRKGWPWFSIRIEPISGEAWLKNVASRWPEWGSESASVDNKSSEISASDVDAYLVGLVDTSAQKMRGRLRALMRISGGIQWWTVFVCWMVLILVFDRFRLLSGKAVSPNMLASGDLDELRETKVYSKMEYLVGLLPTLGFIGTVVGMGDALLTADGLFTSSNKTQAIATITGHLGFAFDTTLIGLLTGIIAGASVLWLRSWEAGLSHEHVDTSTSG